MRDRRAPVQVLLVALLLTVVSVMAGARTAADILREPRLTPTIERAAARATDLRATALLRRWDRRRAAAYRAGDPALLRLLYAPASRAGARDVAVLEQYADRGLVVAELQMQLLEVAVVGGSGGVLRVRVLDRLARSVARAGRSTVSLPAGAPTRRVITFVRVGQRWVVRSVRRP